MTKFQMTTLMLALTLAGCSTMRSVNTGSEASIYAGIEEGDRVAVTTRDGEKYELRISVISESAVEGVDRNGQSVTIPFTQINLLQVHQPRPGRTAAAVAGTIGGIAAATLLIVAGTLAGAGW